MTAALAVAFLFLSCLGAGAAVLHGLGLWRDRGMVERNALAFAIGFGGVGWIVFWVGITGYLTPLVIGAVCVALLAGNLLHRVRSASASASASASDSPSWTTWLLIAMAVAAFAFDALEAFAPPVEADSMAYHFYLPRDFLEQRAVTFVPWAITGAIPLLVHMTYTAALALGGEGALTGWTFVSGWMASVLLFAISRRWLSRDWSLLVALLFQTLPAMVYGAGSGQVEARLALFVLLTVAGLVEFRHSKGVSPVVLIGLGAGFFAAGKLTGLLFLAAAGVAILVCCHRRWFRGGLVFGLAALAAGGQWYGWNFVHTGDPVFPLLFNLSDRMGLANDAYWNAGHAADLFAVMAERYKDFDAGHWFFSYPLLATLAPPPEVGAGRIGLGPFFLLVAPMAAMGIWRNRGRVVSSPLFPVAVLLAVYYVLWMIFGQSPKVRHLLPVVPALLMCLTIAALARAETAARRPIALAGILSLAINFAAHGLYSRPYLTHFLSGETRQAFLLQNLRAYPVVPVLNALENVSRVYILERQLQYHIRPPSFFADAHLQALIDTRVGQVEPDRFFRQLKKQGISHLAMTVNVTDPLPGSDLAAIPLLVARGCLLAVESVAYENFDSRTLRTPDPPMRTLTIWRVASRCAT